MAIYRQKPITVIPQNFYCNYLRTLYHGNSVCPYRIWLVMTASVYVKNCGNLDPRNKLHAIPRFTAGIICGPHWDHLRFGIICGPIWGSFAVWGSFAALYISLERGSTVPVNDDLIRVSPSSLYEPRKEHNITEACKGHSRCDLIKKEKKFLEVNAR